MAKPARQCDVKNRRLPIKATFKPHAGTGAAKEIRRIGRSAQQRHVVNFIGELHHAFGEGEIILVGSSGIAGVGIIDAANINLEAA